LLDWIRPFPKSEALGASLEDTQSRSLEAPLGPPLVLPKGYGPEQIRSLRGSQSRAAFAKRLGVTALTVYRWELPPEAAESRRPRGAILKRLHGYASGVGAVLPPTAAGAPPRHEAERRRRDASEIQRAEYQLLLPILDRIPNGELQRAELDLLQLLAAGELRSGGARALATQALARLCVLARGDGRAAFSMLVPLLSELEAGAFPAEVEFAVHVSAALVFSSPDGRLFDAGKTIVHVTRAERLLDAHGSAEDRLLLWVARFAVAFILNDRQLFERVVTSGQEVLQGHSAPVPRAVALLVGAIEAGLTGRPALATRRFEEVIELCQGRDLSMFRGRALAHMADVLLDEAADPHQVLALAERARRVAHEHRHSVSVQTLLATWAEGEALLRTARFSEAERRLLQALSESDEVGWTPLPIAFSLARLYLLTGDAPALRKLGERLGDYDRPLQRAITLAEGSCMRELAAALEGADPRPLCDALDRAEQLAERGVSWEFVGRAALVVHLSARSGLGSLDSFARALRRAERLLDVAPSAFIHAHLRHWKGVLLCRQGRAQEGRKAIEAAQATFELAGLVPEAALARATLAGLAADLAEPAAAAELERCRAELHALGIRSDGAPRVEALSGPRAAPEAVSGEVDASALLVPIQRLSVRGMTPALIQRELLAVLEELLPGVQLRLDELDGDGAVRPHAEGAFELPQGEALLQRESIELGDGSGRRLRLSACGRLPPHAHDLLTSLASVAGLALEVATLRGFAEQHGRERDAEQAGAELPGFIAASPAMRALKLDLVRLSRSRSTVIVTGESGTGKEIVARALHDLSARASQPFVAFNCASVPRDLFEGQLFGYRRGAYTGANADHPGVIRSALGGTLFLDEVGELPLDVQPKLLRFLENGEVFPLGERRSVQVDVRVVAATHRDLEALVRAGRFREDLFYRLQVVPVRIPALRDRRDDIIALARHFLRLFSAPDRASPVLSPQAITKLLAHDWPGNVRELRNVLERSLAFSPVPNVLDGELITFARS
jgi:tetratricopeptide (TPR) repeat protein